VVQAATHHVTLLNTQNAGQLQNVQTERLLKA
jgi:hypothetical protein